MTDNALLAKLEGMVDKANAQRIMNFLKADESGGIKSIHWKRVNDLGNNIEMHIQTEVLSTLCLIDVLTTRREGSYSVVAALRSGVTKTINPRIKNPLVGDNEEELFFAQERYAVDYSKQVNPKDYTAIQIIPAELS